MGFLSSLFQTGAPVQQVAGPTIATSKLPEELAPYYKDILGKAQALYKEKTAEGYQPYTGPTIAAFSPEQEQAFTGLAGLAGQTKPIFEEAMQKTRTAAAPMTQEQLTTYMSPYQQAVVDIEKREAQKQYESQVVPQLAAKAATTGGFGGSRQAILEGMAADTQQRLLSDIQAKGSQQAYEDAVKRFAADRQAQGQAGAQLATMAPQQFKTQLGELGALQTVGETRQQQQQTALDEAFRQYQLEQNYPYDTMSRYQAIVTGAPVAPTRFADPAPRTPSIGQQLISGIGTLGAAYGQFTGQNPLNLLTGKKHGGGLSDLPVVNAQDGNYLTRLINRMKYKMRNPNIIQPEYDIREHGVPFQTSANIYDRVGVLQEAAKDEEISVGPDGTIMKGGEVITPREAGLYRDNIGLSGSRLTNQEGYALQQIPPARGRGDDPTIIEEGDVEEFEKERKETLSDYIARANQDNQAVDINSEGYTFPPTNQIESSSDNIIKPNIEVAPPIPSPDQPVPLTNEVKKPSFKDMKNTLYQMEQGRIRAAEDNLQKLIEGREEANRKLLEQSQDAQTRAQYGNLAQFFARLGTATPQSEGISGVLGAALGAADQTLPEVMATNEKFRGETTR